MKTNRQILLTIIAMLALLLTSNVVAVSASPTTTGTWAAYPGQSVDASTTTNTYAAYRTAVRPPINADGSSNWSKRRGVIPVQFDLSAATATDLITTTVTGQFVFEAIGSDVNSSNDYAFLSFTPGATLLFKDISMLKIDYSFITGNCHGGALRWSVRVSPTQSVFIYYGDMPNFTDCTTNNQSGINMIALTDLRYDTSQVGGTFYDNYAGALALVGEMPVIRASVVLDGGWSGDQVVDLTSATINDNTFTPLTSGTTVTTTTTIGVFSPTCDLPSARLKWTKTDPVPDGSLNEGESIQPKDTGEFYRIVDCKYIYNLDVSSLDPNLVTRGGTYFVYAEIDGVSVNNPARFDLK